MATLSRRTFVKTGVAGGVLAAGPLGALSSRALGAQPATTSGYGPLVKG